MGWKALLHEYVNQRNRMELNYSISPFIPYVMDPIYLAVQTQRLQRIYELHRERRVQPLSVQTSLNYSQVYQQGNKIITVIDLGQSLQYRQGNRIYNEMRLEREQVILEWNGGKWCIQQISFAPSEAKMLCPQPSLTDHVNLERVVATKASLYDRQKVQIYADLWWNSHNPQYLYFEQDDCTHFVSQCLFAGNAPMHYTGKRELGWWYQGKNNNQELWSFSWAVANSLQRYLSSGQAGWKAEIVELPQKLAVGDVISYDWNGDGRYQHSAIVTDTDSNGMPLVNAHTTSSKHRFWDYRDSYAWTEQTQYCFLRMPDQFA